VVRWRVFFAGPQLRHSLRASSRLGCASEHGPPPSRNFNARCPDGRSARHPAARPGAALRGSAGTRVVGAATALGAPIVVRGASRSTALCGGIELGRAAGPIATSHPSRCRARRECRSCGPARITVSTEDRR
jgi:hypothetical protein